MDVPPKIEQALNFCFAQTSNFQTYLLQAGFAQSTFTMTNQNFWDAWLAPCNAFVVWFKNNPSSGGLDTNTNIKRVFVHLVTAAMVILCLSTLNFLIPKGGR